jgi:hypothetical protein
MVAKLGLSLREDHRLRLCRSMLKGKICEPRIDEAAGYWRELHNEEFHNLYFSRINEWMDLFSYVFFNFICFVFLISYVL